jgi:uncharacterized protein YqgV (UPF0045/DUF77 family)
MDISLEISMYPLSKNFIGEIDLLLEELHNTPNIKVVTNQMSTQVFGNSQDVFGAVETAINNVYQRTTLEQCPFVIKVLKGDVSENTLKQYS